MTRFEQICDAIDEQVPGIDENLTAAFILAIAERRHLVLSTRNSRHVCHYLEMIGRTLFGYSSPVTINCSEHTTWNDIVERVTLLGVSESHTVGPSSLGPVWDRERTDIAVEVTSENETSDLILLNGFGKTSKYMQSMLLNALSASHMKRGVAFPPNITIVIVLEGPPQLLSHHLREKMFLHQYLDPATIGNLSIIESNLGLGPFAGAHVHHNLESIKANVQSYIEELRLKMPSITIVDDIHGYMQDLCVYVRTHRLVSRGLSPRTVRDFETLVRAICVLHDYEFATPSLVAVCARKIFPLKIQLCQPFNEPSLCYGGDVDLVEPSMAKWDEALIIEDVLGNVAPPV